MKNILIILLFFTTTIFANNKKITQMIEPVVQITLRQLVPQGASGTVIYSKENLTLILTNFHVIHAALRNIGKVDEKRQRVNVEFMLYKNGGKIVEKNIHTGYIIAHDINKDLALILVKDFQTNKIAKFLPREKKVNLFDEVWNVGNPLLMERSYFTKGEITGLEIVHPTSLYGKEAKLITTSAPVYQGSSGGATFIEVDDDYYYIGTPHSMAMDGGGRPVDWIVFIVSLETIRKFFEENHLSWIEKNDIPEYLKIYPESEDKIYELIPGSKTLRES